jgi:hypothetical protein
VQQPMWLRGAGYTKQSDPRGRGARPWYIEAGNGKVTSPSGPRSIPQGHLPG